MMSDEAQKILAEMEMVRREVDEDVDDLVDVAKQMTDWRYYVRNYPWLCVGGAALVGYFAIPRRIEVIRPDPDDIEELAKRRKLVVDPSNEKKVKSGVSGQLFNFLSSLALRGLITYGTAQATRLFQSAEEPQAPDPHNPAKPR